MNSFQNPSLGPGGMTPGVDPRQVQQSPETAQPQPQQVGGHPVQQPQPQQAGGYPVQQPQPQQVPGYPTQQPLPQQGINYPVQQPLPHVPGYQTPQPLPQESAFDEEFTVNSGTDVVPPGNYAATFMGYTKKTMRSKFHVEPQKKLDFTFQLDGGPYNGKRVGVLANVSFNPKSKLVKLASMLSGRQLQDGEKFYLSQLKGRPYSIVVQQNAKGFSDVVTAIPLNLQQ
ncbi:MAG: hypothetical protein O2931_06260 [Planctomycetota bacterium]|nr:hypothetical protein [Planctomycetota bacterium]